jgi:hypothetical protein
VKMRILVAVGLILLLVVASVWLWRASRGGPRQSDVARLVPPGPPRRTNPPAIDVRVVADRDAAGKVLVSNLHSVSAVVTVHQPASVSAQEAPSVELMIRDVSSQRPVDARINQNGTSADWKKTQYDFTFEVPPDPDFIASKALQKVRRVEEDERARISRTGGSDQTLRFLREREAQVLAALKGAYHGSRPGVFEVIAVYRVQRLGVGVETIRSEPTRFEVVNDGDYFEQPAFR